MRAPLPHNIVSTFHSTDKKQKIALHRASKAYINQFQYIPKHIRFDVIEVSISEEGDVELKHHNDISLFSARYTPKR